MITLLVSISLPYLRAHAGRILLTLLGVIIGVQGMVAMGALNHSILKSFEAGLEAIAGAARLQIAGPETGIPDSLAEDALQVPGVESAVAVVDGSLTLADDPTLRIRTFGIDLLGMVGTRSPQFPREHVHIEDELRFVNATDSIAVGTPLLTRLHAKLGDTIRLATPEGIRPYVVRGTLDDVGPTKLFGGMVALLDLPTAESVFLAPGLTQTIYITLKPDASLETTTELLRTAIGDRARVEKTEARGQQMDALLGSIRVALSLASLVTMIAAFFIIYETIAISVEQRRREIAIVRSLGFTRGAVAGVFMLESLILGLLGAAGGVVGGYALAKISLSTALAGVNGMYFSVGSTDIALPAGSTLFAIASGCAVCVLAGSIPAYEAATDPPVRVLRGALGAHPDTPGWRSLACCAAVIVAALCVLSIDLRLSSSTTKTSWIMLGHALLIFGVGFTASHYVAAWSLVTSAVAPHFNLSTSLACDFYSRRPRRVAAATSAIMVGYALVIVLGSVVHSIDRTLATWIDLTLGADLKIGTGAGLNSGTFNAALADEVRRLPGVSAVERYQKSLFIFNDQPIVLVGIDPTNHPHGDPLMLIRSTPNAYVALKSGAGVFVSESFSLRYGRDVGDTVWLNTPAGRRRFDIAGVARDYAMDLGTILIEIDIYQALWRDYRLTYAQIWPSDTGQLEQIRTAVNDVVRNYPSVAVVTNTDFRADIEKRVRDLLGVLASLQLFACSIAVLGVINFLLAAVLDRKREIALLRSVGITTAQIKRAVMIEGGLIGCTGATLGLLMGIPAAYLMVTHSIPIAMGWSLDFRFPTTLAMTTLVAITVAASLAAYFPARHITRGTILAGLQME